MKQNFCYQKGALKGALHRHLKNTYFTVHKASGPAQQVFELGGGGGAKDEGDSQIGIGGGTMLEIFDFNSRKMTGNAFINRKLNFYFQMFSAVAIGSLDSLSLN